MKLEIEISKKDYEDFKFQTTIVADDLSTTPSGRAKLAIANGIPIDEREQKLKRWIEKDIETLNYIIESGWLISDLEKCTAIDACEDAITALKQYPVLDKVRAEIEEKARPNEIGGRGNGKSIRYGLCMALEIIDKYRGNVDAI